MTKQWEFYNEDKEKAKKIAEKYNISELVAQIIANSSVNIVSMLRFTAQKYKINYNS